MALLKKKYKANTLMETIVSLVIICIVFYIGTDIMVNITRNRAHIQKVEYSLAGHKIVNESLVNKAFVDEEINFDRFYVQKKCVIQNENTGIIVIQLTFFDYENHEIYKYSEWVTLEI